MRATCLFRFIVLACAAGLAGGALPGQGAATPPAPGAVMIVTIHVATAGSRPPLYRIDALQVMQGTLPGHRPGADDARQEAGPGSGLSPGGDEAGAAPVSLLVRDRAGAVIHQERFSVPAVITIPPVPPGTPDDGLPGVLPMVDQDVALVVPYLDAADRVEVRDTRDPGAAAVRTITPEDRRLPDGRTARETAGVASEPGILNVLLIASGYLPDQMSRFRQRAAEVQAAMLAMEPFASQRASVRITAHENTADLACQTGCGGITRSLCCNASAVMAAAARSGVRFDEIVVIHNTPTYAGFGGRDAGGYRSNSYMTHCGVYDGPSTAAMAVHEFGHSFGNLCDEYALEPTYTYISCVNCRSSCDQLQDAGACIRGCSVKPDYLRPEPSIMLSLGEARFNRTSIDSTFSPDGLRMRLSYFTGSATGTGAKGQFPPRDEVLVFRETLETYYRDTLRRVPGPSHVDVEGEAVWIPEYLRYRLTQCTHDGAVQRVLTQIAGYGIQPGCGGASPGYAFPPRDQTLAFRTELEQVYRVDLGRSPGPTAVDIEGNAVWLQEYLRYRLHGCTHGQASTKVMLQIEGHGIQPVCL